MASHRYSNHSKTIRLRHSVPQHATHRWFPPPPSHHTNHAHFNPTPATSTGKSHRRNPGCWNHCNLVLPCGKIRKCGSCLPSRRCRHLPTRVLLSLFHVVNLDFFGLRELVFVVALFLFFCSLAVPGLAGLAGCWPPSVCPFPLGLRDYGLLFASWGSKSECSGDMCLSGRILDSGWAAFPGNGR